MPRSPSRSPPRGPRGDRDRSRSPVRSAPTRRPKELSFYKKSSSSMGSFSQRRDPLDEMPESAKERMERRDRGEVPARFGGTREHGVRNTMSSIAPQGTAAVGMGSLRRTNDPLDRMPVKGVEADGPDRSNSRNEGFGSQREYDRERERDRDRREKRRDREGGERRSGDGDRRDRRDGDKDREARLAAMGQPVAAPAAAAPPPAGLPRASGRLIEVIANDRMGRKVRIKCMPTDTVGDLKRLIAAQTGTTAQKIQLKKWYTSFKDHVTLQDYEINDGMSLEMY
ncbi:hypothetical protein BCR39DRAFT_522205 [Naematelia encephala]|uniref:Ubiquitin-like modifier HUB1 n=1 Tax=Naematelia encephala TaxID=71784 RepID=A0A1Y2BDF3_9TREE|nr:hypothetical protein BCR39DRAFT_522205 [Naematelia encephala]